MAEFDAKVLSVFSDGTVMVGWNIQPSSLPAPGVVVDASTPPQGLLRIGREQLAQLQQIVDGKSEVLKVNVPPHRYRVQISADDARALMTIINDREG